MYGQIYLAKNKLDNKIYIGQTTLTLEQRKKKHKRNYSHSNAHFHRALRKYGFDNFEWIILEETDTQEKLDNLEIKYIAKYNSIKNGYNETEGGLGGKPSDEVRKKIGEANRGRPSKYKGIPRSEEIRARISLGRRGKNLGPLSKEHKNKISASNLDHSISEVTKQKIGLANRGRILGSLSEEQKQNLSNLMKRRPQRKIECPHCHKVGGLPAMHRWHFDSCPLLSKAAYIQFEGDKENA